MVAGQHVERRRSRRVLLAVLACVLVTGSVTVAGARLLGREDDPDLSAGADCPGPVEVTVSPLLAPPLKEAAAELASDCAGFIVVARPEQDVLEDLFFGNAAPEVWIPQGEWNLEKAEMTVVSEAVASTPVVLVGGPAARPPASWTAALASGRVDLPDPLSDTLGAFTVVTPQLEAAVSGADPESARASLVAVAQRYGDVASRGGTVDTSLDGLGGASRREVVATEAAFLAARRTDPGLVALTPPTGTGLLRFPLAVRDDARPAARSVAADLASWLASERGSASLVSTGLRRGDGAPTAPGTGAGSLSYLPTPTSTDVDGALLTWRVLSIPSSVLAVFDVSGSMAFDAPAGGRRIDVAVDAATTALALFPAHARIGLWAFSTDRGPGGRDWVVLEPTRRLDAAVDGETQRQRLAEAAEGMKEQTDGGTGLYDTALAAYRYAVQQYDENYSNSVILLTDGSNDDPGSISERGLLRRLRTLADPQRPVRIIGVGVSADADLATIRRIAAATGGGAYRADTSEDLLRVFAQEIAGR